MPDPGGPPRFMYTPESCGLAAGRFIPAAHQLGLATLTHTPSRKGFPAELLDRPSQEKAMLVRPVGYPRPGVVVPELRHQAFEETAAWR